MRILSTVIALALLTPPTHTLAAGLGPSKGSQLVTAYAAGACPISGHTGTNSSLISQMVNADGTTTAFTIPPKKIFVLTELTATAGGQVPGDTMLVNAEVGSAATGQLVAGRFTTVESSGSVTVEFQIPTGIAIKSGSAFCVDMLDLTHPGFTGFTVFAHGYFAPDK